MKKFNYKQFLGFIIILILLIIISFSYIFISHLSSSSSSSSNNNNNNKDININLVDYNNNNNNVIQNNKLSLNYNEENKKDLEDEVLIHKNSLRVAVLIPYFGSSLPSWFHSFMFTVQLSSEYLDWYIFTTTFINISTPSNVKLVSINESFIIKRIIQMDSKYLSEIENLEEWYDKFLNVLHLYPYLLVEYKPTLGWIFQDYIKHYSHWAFADIDIMVGRFSIFLSNELLNKYDVYTSSFGDSNRMYLRGQLTIFRNTEFINNLWRNCNYFITIIERLSIYYQTEHNKHSKTKGWKFQSAEGCISKIVTNQNNLTIYVALNQISDAFHAPLSEKESFIIGSTLIRCYQSPIDFKTLDLTNYFKTFSRLPIKSSNQTTSLQSLDNLNCEYWVDPKYQVCIDPSKLSTNMDIIWKGSSNIIGSQVSYSIPTRRKSGSCREGLISHFQGWKDGYYQFTTRPPSLDAHSLLITQYGLIPLRFNENEYSIPTMKDSLSMYYNQIGKDSHKNIYTGRECNGIYCIKYNTKLKGCLTYLTCDDISYHYQSDIDIDSENNNKIISNKNKHDVTLIVIGNEDSISSGALERTIFSWIGTKVIVLQYNGIVSNEIKQFIIRILGSSELEFIKLQNDIINNIETKKHHKFQSKSDQNTCLVLVTIKEKDILSSLLDKTLFNIGMDMSLTDKVLLSHPGYVFSTNLKSFLIHNLTYLSQKGVSKDGDNVNGNGNNVFIIPAYLSNHNKLFQLTKGNTDKLCGWSNQPSRITLETSLVQQIQKSKQSFPIVRSNSNESYFYSFVGIESSLLPVAFNMKSSQYGSSFLRFPMELNGKSCYDTVFYSILESSGYQLYWSKYFASIDSIYLQKKREKSQCANNCQYYENNKNFYDEFIKNLSRYFRRIKELKTSSNGDSNSYSNSLSNIFTRNEFGHYY